MLDSKWQTSTDGHALLRLPSAELTRLQRLIGGTLAYAADEPDGFPMAAMQDSLLAGFDQAVRAGAIHSSNKPRTLARYRMIVGQVNESLSIKPMGTSNEELAEEIGTSVRTLQTASQLLCGLSIHRYSRLKRLWSVRRQLQTGAAGLTVKASALAYGFSHISQFTEAYCESFGELPSATLSRVRRRATG